MGPGDWRVQHRKQVFSHTLASSALRFAPLTAMREFAFAVATTMMMMMIVTRHFFHLPFFFLSAFAASDVKEMFESGEASGKATVNVGTE